MKLVIFILAGFFFASDFVAADDPSGFTSIFDGKTLNGWHIVPSKYQSAWQVKNGILVGKGEKTRCHLEFDQKDIADFELKFQYRFPANGNSGVNIRAIPDKTGKRDFQAYHVDLGHVGIGRNILGAWDFHTPGRKEHRCFRGDSLVIDREDRPTILPIKNGIRREEIHKNDWNQVHVIAKGNRFRFFINGKLASEFTEHLPLEKRLVRGAIQLQLHDPDMVVHFRELHLKRLD